MSVGDLLEKGRGNVTEGLGNMAMNGVVCFIAVFYCINLPIRPTFVSIQPHGMAQKEAKARIKIDLLLREAGWRFFDEEGQRQFKEHKCRRHEIMVTFHRRIKT